MIVIVAGSVDRELPAVGGADVTQPAQFLGAAVGEQGIDLGEAGPVAHARDAQLRPALADPGSETFLQ